MRTAENCFKECRVFSFGDTPGIALLAVWVMTDDDGGGGEQGEVHGGRIPVVRTPRSTHDDRKAQTRRAYAGSGTRRTAPSCPAAASPRRPPPVPNHPPPPPPPPPPPRRRLPGPHRSVPRPPPPHHVSRQSFSPECRGKKRPAEKNKGKRARRFGVSTPVEQVWGPFDRLGRRVPF